jgi:hypothetical protein
MDALLDQFLDSLHWTTMAPSERGIVNLGFAGVRHEGTNTTIARFDLASNHAALVPMRLGFSDRARVYLNGRLLYAGDATYRSRDPRFLGTIGLHDTLYLPLVRGRNHIAIAVTEASGGWGVTAAIDEQPGLSVRPP